MIQLYSKYPELQLKTRLSVDEAIALQTQARSLVITEDFDPEQNDNLKFPKILNTPTLKRFKTVAGIDVGYAPKTAIMQAVITVLDMQTLTCLEMAIAISEPNFPYVPGLLSFREVPIVLDAFQKLNTLPDLLVCDGQGLAHPRRFGLACHLGVLTDLPTIGVAKSHYIGEHKPLETLRGAWQPLRDQGETVGAIVRTQTNIKPVYVSIGHRVSLPTAIALTLHLTPRYRLPETTRQADHRSRQFATSGKTGTKTGTKTGSEAGSEADVEAH